MNPFEDLIQSLGKEMGASLKVDSHQSCRLHFPAYDVHIQIDLDAGGDQILVGSELGTVNPGSFREKIFIQAMRVNGMSKTPRGFLAYSEKNYTLVLFQFFSLSDLKGEKLFHFLMLFAEHARIWKESIMRGEIPTVEEERADSRM